MTRKRKWILTAVLLLAALAQGAGLVFGGRLSGPALSGEKEKTAREAEETAELMTDEALRAGDWSAPAYVLVTSPSRSGWLALPREGTLLFRLTDGAEGEAEAFNLIRLTPEGVRVEDANCRNRDCVGQGTVTLENRSERLLGALIVCLPHQAVLQLFSPEEARERIGDASS